MKKINRDSHRLLETEAQPLGQRESINGDCPYLSWEWTLLGLVLLLGLLLRVAYLGEIIHEPTFSYTVYDPQYNDYWARGMATGEWVLPAGVNDPEVRTTPHGRPPGYPHFLAGVYWLFGANYLAPRLVQMALGLVNVVLIFLLGRAVFGRAVGLVSAAFLAVYWAFIYFEGLLTYPAVVVFVLLVLMHVLRLWHRRPAFQWALLAGIVLGVFGLFRPNGLLFVPVLAVWMGWVLHRRGAWRPVLAGVVGLVLGVLIALTPGVVRNYRVAGDFVFISSYGGLNFYVGNNEEASCVEPRIPELEELAGIRNWCCFDYPLIVRGLGEKLGKENLRFSEANRYFYGQAIRFIREHPLKFLKNTGKKALLFWGPREITNDTVLAYDKRHAVVLRYLPGFPWVLALFLVGLAAVVGSRGGVNTEPRTAAASWEFAVVLALFVFTYFLSVIPFFIAGRYRVPIIPFLLLFGAYAVVHVARFVRSRAYGRAGLWTVAGAVLLGLAHWNPTGYEPSLAVWHFRYALAQEHNGDAASAIGSYRQAIAAGEEPDGAHANLARLLAREGRAEEAVAAFREALERQPDNVALHNDFGYELVRLKHFEEAIEQYRAALGLDSKFVLAHNNLGNALLGQGQFEEAEKHFLEAARIEPEDRHASYNLGNLFLEQGELEEAVEQYETALAIHPDYPEAHNNLGYALARQSRPEEAEQHYLEALRLNPAFARAHVNLGNLYEVLGQTDDAAHHYGEALELLPGNRYLLERLSAVAEGKAPAAGS